MTFLIRHQKDKIKSLKGKLISCIKIKNFCSVKDTVRRMEGQSIDLEIIFAKHTFCGIVSKIYKELLKLNNKTNDPILSRQKT